MIAISEGSLGAYWTARKESVEACAGRFALCLRELHAASPAFAAWFHTKERRHLPAAHDPEFLRDLLLAGRNRKDFPPREVIEELGFSASLVTDHPVQEQLALRVVCGMYSEDPGIVNHCLLKFSATGHLAFEAVQLDVKTRALRALIEAWDPDWAALRSRRLSKAIQARGNVTVEPYFGWISYVSRRRGTVPQEVRERYSCESLSTLGDFIYVTREAFDDRDPRLVDAAVDLYSLLERERLLNRSSRVAPRP